MPTVGDILSAERRRQGKSLADAVEGTKIRSRLLDALEHGRYDELPSPAYVKGYIQSYARWLEIPTEPLLDEYRRESAGKRPSNPADRYLAGIPAETVVPAREGQHAIPRNVVIAVAAGAVLLVLLLCGISRLIAGSGADTTPTSPSGAASSDVSASPGASGTTEPTTSIVTTTGGFKLRVTVRDGLATWLKVQVDGLKAYEGTLQGGDSREWLVTGNAVLTVGKPAAVVVTRDGKDVALPKADNSSVTLTTHE